MKTENLSTLKIHKLTQAQYDRELAAGRIDENAIYLTPDEDSGGAGIPDPSTATEGSFLRVQNDVAVWDPVPSAENGYFGGDTDLSDLPVVTCNSHFTWYGTHYIYDGYGLEEYYYDGWDESIGSVFPIVYPDAYELKYANKDLATKNYWSATIVSQENYENKPFIKEVSFDGAGHLIFTVDRVWCTSATLLVKYIATVNGVPSWVHETVECYIDMCLLKGTQILMADGSTKAIEDVKSGDMLKSWDFETNDYINVRCLAAYTTGIDEEWKEYTFSDGNTLKIAHEHAIYNQEEQYVMSSSSWKKGATGLGIDGSAPTLTKVVNKSNNIEPPRHYTILSENNVYFADGILCGHQPGKKYTIYRGGLIKCDITPEQVELFKEEHKRGHLHTDWKKDKRFKEQAPKYGKYNDTKARVKMLKETIAARDYKTIKRMQGLLSDEEWNENLEICANLRTQINETEALGKQILKHHADVRESLGYPRKPKNHKQLFNEGMKQDNAFIRANAIVEE